MSMLSAMLWLAYSRESRLLESPTPPPTWSPPPPPPPPPPAARQMSATPRGHVALKRSAATFPPSLVHPILMSLSSQLLSPSPHSYLLLLLLAPFSFSSSSLFCTPGLEPLPPAAQGRRRRPVTVIIHGSQVPRDVPGRVRRTGGRAGPPGVDGLGAGLLPVQARTCAPDAVAALSATPLPRCPVAPLPRCVATSLSPPVARQMSRPLAAPHTCAALPARCAALAAAMAPLGEPARGPRRASYWLAADSAAARAAAAELLAGDVTWHGDGAVTRDGLGDMVAALVDLLVLRRVCAPVRDPGSIRTALDSDGRSDSDGAADDLWRACFPAAAGDGPFGVSRFAPPRARIRLHARGPLPPVCGVLCQPAPLAEPTAASDATAAAAAAAAACATCRSRPPCPPSATSPPAWRRRLRGGPAGLRAGGHWW